MRVTDHEGAHEAVGHLVAHGHRRIAFLGETAEFSTVQDRLVGLHRRAASRPGSRSSPASSRRTCWNADVAYPLALAMLAPADAPTAVFASTPLVGLGVLRALKRLGRQDIALVVFGDFPLAELMTPPTTVVDQRPIALAHAAFDHLARRLDDPQAPVVETVLPTRLVQRGSGELPPREASRETPPRRRPRLRPRHHRHQADGPGRGRLDGRRPLRRHRCGTSSATAARSATRASSSPPSRTSSPARPRRSAQRPAAARDPLHRLHLDGRGRGPRRRRRRDPLARHRLVRPPRSRSRRPPWTPIWPLDFPARTGPVRQPRRVACSRSPGCATRASTCRACSGSRCPSSSSSASVAGAWPSCR